MEIEETYFCPYCLQLNTILIDVTAGTHQEIIEDCQVCCRAAQLTIEVDIEGNAATVTADLP